MSHPSEEFAGRRITVAGLGVSGVSVARALAGLGARITVVDGGDGPALHDRAAGVERAGGAVRLGDADTLPVDTDLVVTSPGWRPDSPLFVAAMENGVEVLGDVEIAWRLRGERPTPWLAVTGTNGKTTTVRMLSAVLAAAGLRTAAVGNIGTPLIDVVRSDPPYDVLAVELSSYQLHWAPSLRPYAAALLNLAPDHLDWHGSMAAYTADKGRIYRVASSHADRPGAGSGVGCRVYNVADPTTERLAREAEAEAGAGSRTVGFTLGPPAPLQLGVVEDELVDRAFVADPERDTETLARLTDLVSPSGRPAPHIVANALAAAALARAFGVSAPAVRDGLRAFRPDAHRIAEVATVSGVVYVDDSKATNPHAAGASLAAFDPIVWIAGGLAKGATFDDLVRASAKRLRGVVLMGADRQPVREALTRHAPDVPVVDLGRTDTGAMAAAVREAARLARAGDTVLLAPACASMDMFVNYSERGDAFAAAVRAMASGHSAYEG